MKKFKIIPFFILALLIGQVYAHSMRVGAISISEKLIYAASIAWKSESHDFGEITKNEPVTATFDFINTGNSTLIISDVKASCGCTVTDYPKHGIQPGGTAKITATYNSKKEGAFVKHIKVFSNSPEGSHTLVIKGTVI